MSTEKQNKFYTHFFLNTVDNQPKFCYNYSAKEINRKE